ncbi:hypothetical protein [Salidesulfovibrio onnuriiensis]|uniref:hypothetical protein n=1 Tax=Salidesulfovibrio onnuriiensis TaxID=2583823 RepID=UPI00202B77A4|nr:hypothetical protein [Salidesulfovibrio onnuriiensis]
MQKLANAELVKSDIQKQLFAPVIAEHLRKQGKEQVQGIDKKEKADAIDRDGSNKQEQQFQQQERKGKEASDKEETSPSTDSPWAGNIINVKI